MPANSKKKKNKTPDPAKMKPETVEKVVAKELWRDERTHKIIGAFFLLIAFLLFVAFFFNFGKEKSCNLLFYFTVCV